MIRFACLGSSSKGNSLFFDIDGTKILIDAGLSFKALNKNLATIGKSLDGLDSIFITHGHGDHNTAVKMILKKNPKVVIYSEDAGLRHGAGFVLNERGSLVTPFRLSHDSPCHGFIVEDSSGNKVAVITDTGTIPCDSLEFLLDCNAIILEFNHDVTLLTESPYPMELQERIFSDQGHLRNEQARELLELISWPGLEIVMCYHLSEKNNSKALAEYEAYAGVQFQSPGCNIVCAEKSSPSQFFVLM
jgi:phosphoribosyl 1,2-cyclic phosphodiesterase